MQWYYTDLKTVPTFSQQQPKTKAQRQLNSICRKCTIKTPSLSCIALKKDVSIGSDEISASNRCWLLAYLGSV